MLQILINFVFKILSVVANIVFYPLQLLLNAFIPGLGSTLSKMGGFLAPVTVAVPLLLYLFNVPVEASSIFFTYILGKYAFYLGYIAVKFILKAYQKLKP